MFSGRLEIHFRSWGWTIYRKSLSTRKLC